jgi:hypothetical protein
MAATKMARQFLNFIAELQVLRDEKYSVNRSGRITM